MNLKGLIFSGEANCIISGLGTISILTGGIGKTVVTVLAPSVIVWLPAPIVLEFTCELISVYSTGENLGVTVSTEVTFELIWLGLSE